MSENDTLNARCPLCGEDFNAATTVGEIPCPHCGRTIRALQATKYYESVTESGETAKEAHGEDYHKVRLLIDECYGLLKAERYDEAEEKANEALSLTETDYRAYMAMVAVKTKNFTDLKDETHTEYLNKAISVADKDERADIKAQYKNFYEKRKFSDEEMEKFVEETRKDVKQRVEKSLKGSIPTYMATEKTLIWLLIFFPLLMAAGVALVIVALAQETAWISIVGVALAIGGYITLRVWLSSKEAVKAFNATLDLYDTLDAAEMTDEKAVPLYKALAVVAEKFSDRVPVVSMNDAFGELINKIIDADCEEVNKFMLGNKFFKKMVVEDDEKEEN